MSANDDRRRVRRAALAVGLWVGTASAVVITVGVGILIAIILATSRTIAPPVGVGQRDLDADHLVVDVDRVVPWVIVLGIAGVLILALIAWLTARRSVHPLGEALRLQRNFVADASHELRTPLTTLTSRIQIAQRRDERGDPVSTTLAELRRDAAAMGEVLTDMLLSAEGGQAEAVSVTAIAEAASAAVGSLELLAQGAGVRITLDIRDDVAIPLTPITARRIVVALVDNAIQHAPAESTVTVDVRRAAGFGEVRVSDQGAGVRGIEPARIFERFARSGETGRRRGFGIGLSLVREIADGAGGSVTVETTSAAGTVFLLRLPSVG